MPEKRKKLWKWVQKRLTSQRSIAGHEDAVRVLEEIYFSILCKGAILHIAASTFFTGRGITRPVMIFTVISVVINIPLNYTLIFGHWGLPEMGITWFGMGVGGAWLCVLLFVIGLFLLSAGRYRTGKWQKMLVIEKEYRKS